MARASSPLAFVAKWLLVPIALGAIGYLVVGPKVGGVLSEPTIEAAALNPETLSAANTKTEPSPSRLPAPIVEVTSRRAAYQPNLARQLEPDRERERPRRRTRRRKPVEPRAEPLQEAPAVIEAPPAEVSPAAAPPPAIADGDG